MLALGLAAVASLIVAAAPATPPWHRGLGLEDGSQQEANCRRLQTTLNGKVVEQEVCRGADGRWAVIDDDAHAADPDDEAAADAAAAAAAYLVDEEPGALTGSYQTELYCLHVLQAPLLFLSESGDPRAASLHRAFRYFTGVVGQRVSDGEVTSDQLAAELDRLQESEIDDPARRARDLDMCEALGN